MLVHQHVLKNNKRELTLAINTNLQLRNHETKRSLLNPVLHIKNPTSEKHNTKISTK